MKQCPANERHVNPDNLSSAYQLISWAPYNPYKIDHVLKHYRNNDQSHIDFLEIILNLCMYILIFVALSWASFHHSLTLALQAQNLPFQQILPTVDFFYLLDCLTITGLDRTYHAHHFVFSFTFLPRDAMQARSMLSCSVRPSVRLSRSWITSKRINISSKFFHLPGPR